jgi:hypothetical protein
MKRECERGKKKKKKKKNYESNPTFHNMIKDETPSFLFFSLSFCVLEVMEQDHLLTSF